MEKRNLCVLQNISKARIFSTPYPYLVIEDALPWDVYNELEKSYPKLSLMMEGKDLKSNSRYQISVKQQGLVRELPPIWREFIDFHCSQEFFHQVIDGFGDLFQASYPDIDKFFDRPLRNWQVGKRGIDKGAQLVMDCQPGHNSPVLNKTSSVRGPHLDNPVELYAGLLYFRSDDDDSTGGELEVYEYNCKNPTFHTKAEIDYHFVKKVNQVPYKKNMFAMFINTFDSLHGVADRSVTPHCRRLVNIIGESYLHGGFFQIPKENIWKSRLRRLKGKIFS